MIFQRFRPTLLAFSSTFSIFIGAASLPARAQDDAPRSLINGAPPVVIKPQATGEIGANNVTWQSMADGAWRAIYKADVEYPGLRFEAGKAYAETNWSGAGALAVDVSNPGKEAVEFAIRVDDSLSADGNNHSRTGTAKLAPGERADFLFMLDAAAPGMQGGPPFPVPRPRVLSNIYGSGIQSNSITSFQFFMVRSDKTRALDLYSIRWLPSQSMKGIVDKFGQFTRADWPGKVRQETELVRRAGEEKAWLAQNPTAPDRDEYGGWKAGPKLKATGFFRTAAVKDGKEVAPFGVVIGNRERPSALPTGARWWLVTPSGHLFWSVGIDVVGAGEGGPIKGREAMFAELSDEARNRGETFFYRDNLGRKYGAASDKQWIEIALQRLPAWGFNTIGNWSRGELQAAKRVPYVASFGTPGDVPRLGDYGLFDYFDPAFATAIRKSAQDGTQNTKTDPLCVGYFVDNEINWDRYGGGTAQAVATAAALNTAPTGAAHQALSQILRDKYPTVAAWNAAWGIEAPTFDAQIALDASKFNQAAQTDAALFLSALARQYYSTVRAALREAAPNQLYLGSRFAPKPREVVLAAAQFCDVVSFNIYKPSLNDPEYGFLADLGKPVIIGEFHFGALDRGMFSGGLVPVATQAARAKAYETYIKSAAARPEIVGAHWFQYIDEPLTGRFDGENHNIGFVDVTDTPYPELREAARRVNNSIYQLAR